MGIRLSSSGGLTHSQKITCKNPAEEAKLLDKLSGISSNKPILVEIEKQKQVKAEKTKGRADVRASAKVKESKRKRG